MQKLTEQQANKVAAKYLPIIEAKFKNDPKADVGINSPADIGNMCYVYVSLLSKDEIMVDLEVFCNKYEIDYDIKDCL